MSEVTPVPGVTYRKGTRERTFLGYELWYAVYRTKRSTVFTMRDDFHKWMKGASPVDGTST